MKQKEHLNGTVSLQIFWISKCNLSKLLIAVDFLHYHALNNQTIELVRYYHQLNVKYFHRID